MRSWDLPRYLCQTADLRLTLNSKHRQHFSVLPTFVPAHSILSPPAPGPPLSSLQGTPTEWDPQMVRVPLALKGLMAPAKVSWDKGGRGLAGGRVGRSARH